MVLFFVMPKSHAGRRYDLWWLDPFKYTQHLKDSGENQVVFTFSKLTKYRIDAREFMRQHFHGLPWKCYVFHNQVVCLIDHTCGPQEIRGSWPVWDAETYDLEELKDYIETPWLGRPLAAKADWWDVPQPGQPHRVFVMNLRAGTDEFTIKRRQRLTKIQRLYPEVELFIKPYSFNLALLMGCGFAAGCLDPYLMRWLRRGQVYLPNGMRIDLERCEEFENEIAYLGFDWEDVQYDQDIGLLFTIAAIRYAAHHWDDETGPFYARHHKYGKPDYHNPDMYAEMPSYERMPSFKLDSIKETDKIVCDSCALWRKCPVYRPEAVCGLTSSDSKRLADMALSRNADDVVEMLASIVSKQAERAEKKLDDEKFLESGYDKDVDKMLNNVFKNGVQLAKLRDPTLGRPLVQINANVQQPAKAIESADPRALAMGVIQEIESTGVKREDITEEMIQQYMQNHYAPKQLEGEVVDAEVSDE